MVLLAPPAYFSAPNLLPLIALRMVQMSVRYGNAPESAYAYVLYGMLHCAVLADPVRGLAYGDLARQLAVDLDARDLEGRILMVYAGFIQHWSAPLVETLPIFLEGAEKAISAGDLEHHGYHHYGHASYAFMGGLPLAKVSDYLESHQAAEGDARHEKTRRIMRMAGFSIARMRGLADAVHAGDGERESEDESFAVWTEQRDATSLAYFHKYRMLDALMRDDFREVLARARGMEANLNGIVSMAYEPFYQFYEALALIELGAADGAASRSCGVPVRGGSRDGWSVGPAMPPTISPIGRCCCVQSWRGRRSVDRAMQLFAAAVAAARRAGALHDVGLFSERAARFYLKRGADTAAAGYLSDAVDAFEVWGASAWSQVLAERYGDLVQPRTTRLADPSETSSSSSSHGQIVDSATLIRAAAALARKVSLKDVVTEVMRAMVINAGATRGVLLLDVEDRLQVAAVGDAKGEVQVLTDGSAIELHGIPTGLVSFVRRAGSVSSGRRLRGSDLSIRSAHPGASGLVAPVRPLLSKGDVVGMVYLENAGVRGAFSADRCITVETLGAQAAVSIENARLYDSLRSSLERQAELTFAHARFVPHQFLETLGRPSIGDIKLGDHVLTKASILFSDIRGFTSLVEGMAPVDAIQFINTYLSRMEPAVLAEGGFIDNYVGDAIMAVFDRGADAAVRAGIAMLRSLGDWARTRERQGQSPIRIGVGIATGEMIFGTIGAANRLKCGVVGDTVNLAARIEGLTKYYGLGC
jgi:class 3 adenylate cyclase